MSNVFNENISNLGSAAVERATEERNKYNQELTKKEMISQTEESLGGIKLFTSGRELGAKLLKDSKLKPYLKQQFDKAMGKARNSGKNPPKPENKVPEPEDELIKPELQEASKVTNDFSDERLARIGRIAERRKGRKIQQGMSEEDAEADQNVFIQGRVDQIISKDRLNNSIEKVNNEANENATSQFQADTEARANLKAAAIDKEQQAKTKGEGGDEDADVAGEEGAAEEGAEITGTEAAASVLDAIPGLDILGLGLGIGGLAAGFGKKPPQEITGPVNQNSYSNQLGLN